MINEMKLQAYVENEEIYEFDNEQAFLDFVNTERKASWSDQFPNDFKTFEETKAVDGKFLFQYKGKYYWIAFESCLNVYENSFVKLVELLEQRESDYEIRNGMFSMYLGNQYIEFPKTDGEKARELIEEIENW